MIIGAVFLIRLRVVEDGRQRKLCEGAPLEKEEAGRKEGYTDSAMALDEWREVVDTYEAMEEEKKAESTNAQKEFAKAHRMRDNLCKRRGNKRAIDSPVVTTSSGDIDPDDDSDEVTESEARANLRNQSAAFAEEPPTSDIPNSPANQQLTTRKRKSRRSISTHNRIRK